jgi:AraC-like DNA-binding protein
MKRSTVKVITNNELDEKFIEKLSKYIEDNIENENLYIQFLCNEMAVSRTVLFSKMKNLIGQTPNEFIQNIKLKKVALLLKNNPDMKIAEIADSVVFSIKCFSTCFKSQFGVSPSEYRS